MLFPLLFLVQFTLALQWKECDSIFLYVPSDVEDCGITFDDLGDDRKLCQSGFWIGYLNLQTKEEADAVCAGLSVDKDAPPRPFSSTSSTLTSTISTLSSTISSATDTASLTTATTTSTATSVPRTSSPPAGGMYTCPNTTYSIAIPPGFESNATYRAAECQKIIDFNGDYLITPTHNYSAAELVSCGYSRPENFTWTQALCDDRLLGNAVLSSFYSNNITSNTFNATSNATNSNVTSNATSSLNITLTTTPLTCPICPDPSFVSLIDSIGGANSNANIRAQDRCLVVENGQWKIVNCMDLGRLQSTVTPPANPPVNPFSNPGSGVVNPFMGSGGQANSTGGASGSGTSAGTTNAGTNPPANNAGGSANVGTANPPANNANTAGVSNGVSSGTIISVLNNLPPSASGPSANVTVNVSGGAGGAVNQGGAPGTSTAPINNGGGSSGTNTGSANNGGSTNAGSTNNGGSTNAGSANNGGSVANNGGASGTNTGSSNAGNNGNVFNGGVQGILSGQTNSGSSSASSNSNQNSGSNDNPFVTSQGGQGQSLVSSGQGQSNQGSASTSAGASQANAGTSSTTTSSSSTARATPTEPSSDNPFIGRHVHASDASANKAILSLFAVLVFLL